MPALPIKDILKVVKSEREQLENKNCELMFPVSCMPEKIRKIIKDVCYALRFNEDYLASSILSAVSSSIGSTYRIKIKESWTENSVIYISLVGRPGINKSAPLNWSYKPLYNIEAERYNTYQKQLKEFKSVKSANNVESAASKPKREQTIISDATIEAVCYVHSFNHRGLALVVDELVGWIKNLNKYNKGSDQEFWLQNWSNVSVSINRKNDEDILIVNPFINVVGTIQPKILNEIEKDGRKENGFIDRILFAYPKISQRPSFHFDEPNETSFKSYSDIINKLLLLDFNENGKANILSLSREAKEVFQDWSEDQKLILEENNNDVLSGIFAKLEVYVFRFALIYQLLLWACNEADKYEIEEKAMLSAIDTVEYFKKMALKVTPVECDLKVPVTQQKANIYKELKNEFKTAEGIMIAAKYNMRDRAFKHWVKDQALFIKIKHGHYSKNL
jgi:hypothetical protein